MPDWGREGLVEVRTHVGQVHSVLGPLGSRESGLHVTEVELYGRGEFRSRRVIRME